MCEFVSWKKDSLGEVFFLTDKDVFSPHGRSTLLGTKDNDVFGHGAITAFYGKAVAYLAQFENKKFWKKSSFPAEIATHLESPETLLDTWGNMLRRYLQPDDAYYILTNAPEPWRSALFDICFDHVVKDPEYTYNTLIHVKGLTRAQRNTLVKGVVKDAFYACETLYDVKGLTEIQRNALIKGVVKDAYYTYDTLLRVKGLTEIQRNALVKRVAKSAEYAYDTLLRVKGLTEIQRNALIKGVVKDAFYARHAFFDVKGLTKTQRELLRKNVA